MRQELKTLLFRCDLCGAETIVQGPEGMTLPPGWQIATSQDKDSPYLIDVCPDCVAELEAQ